jgi:hypothetical protein
MSGLEVPTQKKEWAPKEFHSNAAKANMRVLFEIVVK